METDITAYIYQERAEANNNSNRKFPIKLQLPIKKKLFGGILPAEILETHFIRRTFANHNQITLIRK